MAHFLPSGHQPGAWGQSSLPVMCSNPTPGDGWPAGTRTGTTSNRSLPGRQACVTRFGVHVQDNDAVKAGLAKYVKKKKLERLDS